ncbi:hypothetical protein AMTR_s00014p00111430 [Amborella trichopoda]|uniref:Uncharacterized protein n=1 Tax=Amborella trichopoda TaxID=13333 RepID=W1PM23_AMBTC|nr:hypothetical protein AMTR_s00014p00111430 [Amborella trichopoda]
MVETVCMVMEAPNDGGPTDVVSTKPEIVQPSTISPQVSDVELRSEPDAPSSKILNLVDVTTPEMPTSTVSNVEPRFELKATPDEALVPFESSITIEAPSLAMASSL